MKRQSKFLMVLLLALMITGNLGSQIPVTDVAANTAAQQANAQLQTQNMTSREISKTQKLMKNLEKAIEEAKKQTGWVKDLQTVNKLKSLIQSTMCGIDKLAWLTKNTHGVHTCFYDFQYEMAMIKLSASAENLMVILSKFSMERSDRMALMNNSIDLLEEAQMDIAILVNEVGAAHEEEKLIKDQKAVFTMSPYRKQNKS